MSELIIFRRLNKRLIALCDSTVGETIGVLKKNGEYKYVAWGGFIREQEARVSKLKWVKLSADHVGRSDDLSIDRSPPLPLGRHVLGCLKGNLVFAVVRDDFVIL